MQGGPRITHIDDVPAEEMARFRFEDGHTASIWEKWIELSPRYLAFWNNWEPGALSPEHGHHGDHINYILQGEIRSRDHVCRAGSHIMLEYGDVFGPWVAGPEGATLYGFVAGVGWSFAGDPDVWQAWLDEHGAVSVPLPMPKRLPPWRRAELLKQRTTNWVED
ncbi:hypothetical protein [Pseudonocardia pini]|uniref:hypothetical protein n=1 Tax=Pseudonocardia pini TaxID=2758030 RepID=UPI0015F019B6|nr:hypothetical protein [Pseudonocardia pini]